VIHAEMSDAVRRAVSQTDQGEDMSAVVDRARSALLEAEGISLFGLETDHPELGPMHWLVGQPAGDEPSYLVLAIAGHVEDGEERAMFSAADVDLDAAFRQVICECGMTEAA
jgi:hypothetical protein